MDWRQKQALDHYITNVPEPTDEKCSCGHMDYDHEWDETGEDSAGYTYCLVETVIASSSRWLRQSLMKILKMSTKSTKMSRTIKKAPNLPEKPRI